LAQPDAAAAEYMPAAQAVQAAEVEEPVEAA
jgi:hypothetical protein